ncbi:hypothetical protein LWI28_016033 [Acer negundo]|uniref:Uncharacterized protein n=1 Tax=Acer negundo TaxID=4023 RepID=A0AAD5JLW3_ACENE|nr:hypothetical protein LWI28_016033 [Acer negundo]
MPRQSRPGGDSRGGVGGHPHGWDGKFVEVMDAVQSLRVDMMEAIRKSDEKRDQQHQELLDMIGALQGQGQGQERTEVPGGTEISVLEQVPPPVIPDDSAGTETGLLVRELPGGSVPHVLPHDLAHGSSSQRTPPPVDP